MPANFSSSNGIELGPVMPSSSGTIAEERTLDQEDGETDEPLLPSSSQNRNSDAAGTTISELLLKFFSRLLGHRARGQITKLMKRASKSKLRHLASKLKLEPEPGLSDLQSMLTNHDLKPVEYKRRQWGAWNFVGFWVADSFNINTWMIASSMITGGGLAWWHAWTCVWIGYFISACFICLTGKIGATYHISFPAVARASFGTWGSLWPVFNRAAMACIWYGVQAWIGGNCVSLMIRAIWPSYYDPQNAISSTGTTARDFFSFLIFWTASLPAIWFPVHKIRHLFTVKAFLVPAAGIAYFIWAISRAHGIGPIIHRPATVTGSSLTWGWISAIMSSIANFATVIVNNPDFSRFARQPSDAVLPQLLTIPIGFAATSFIGIIVSSSSQVIFGTPIWNPLDLLSEFLLEESANPAQRFGVFVIAAAFTLAQLGTNIAANSVSAGTDFTALFPRYLNIRRGGYICAIIGLVIRPWNLLKTSNRFTTYLSAYSVFLSSIAGVIITDYYLVRRGYLELLELYSASSSSPYFYSYGWSSRGYAAYICGVLINLPGFIDAVGSPIAVPMGAIYIYRFNFFAGFGIAGVVYYVLCWMFPVPATSGKWHEMDSMVDMRYDAEHNDSEDGQVFFVDGGDE